MLACDSHPAGTYLLVCGELPGGAVSSGGKSEEMLCFGECRVDSRLMGVICGESRELGLGGGTGWARETMMSRAQGRSLMKLL